MENKLTDNEIIKALERCGYHNECCYCNSVEECGNKRVLAASTLDLINRQKAEIERLQKDKKVTLFGVEHSFCNLLGNCLVFSKNLKDYNDMRKGLKSEAIKEFAEGLKERAIYIPPIGDRYGVDVVFIEDIDFLVKEMVGE